jgi:DNA-3-methyladenine glycosylase I
MKRCAWSGNDPLMIHYHDTEWGVPVHDDRKHFEYIVLDGFQAGLNWSIILKKRENFRKALHNFEPERIARYTARDTARLLKDPGIIRNRQKVAAVVTNARAFLKTRDAFGSFNAYIWQFVDGKPLTHRFRRMSDIPARSRQSDAMSRDLQQRGFKFVGSTICYAYMQAAGMINDHTLDCFRYGKVG